MASLDLDSENFVKEFYIPSYILVSDSEAECLPNVPECPVLVFINSKSGGQLGGDLLITYRTILNKNQVFDLGEESPNDVLNTFFINLEKLKLNGDEFASELEKKLKIIVAGGDGTAGWLLGVVSDLKLTQPPPIATVPLGTGNNLPFAFGWGKKNPGTDRNSVLSFLDQVRKAREMKIDSWHILMRMRAPKEGPCNPIAPLELPHSLHAFHKVSSTDDLNVEGCDTFRGGFWNYFSMGMDAQVSYAFHTERKLHPEKFKNQLHNQSAYAKIGCSQGWFMAPIVHPSSRNIAQLCKLKVMKRHGNWQDLHIPHSIRSIVCLNLPSFSGGLNPWGTPNINKRRDRNLTAPYVDDGLIEIVGFRDAWRGLVLLAPNGQRTRLAQAHRIRFEFHKGAADYIYMRIDGEPWKQPLPNDDDTVIVEISHFGQVKMLATHNCRCRSILDPSSPIPQDADERDSDNEDDSVGDEWRKFGAADTFRIPDDVYISHLGMADKLPQSNWDLFGLQAGQSSTVADTSATRFFPGFFEDPHLVPVFNSVIDPAYSHVPLSVEANKLLFPLSTLDFGSLLLDSKVLPPFEYRKFKSLPRGDSKWNAWVARLKQFDGNTWQKQGIYQLIQMSTLETIFDLDLIEGVLRWWEPSCNSFIFPCGPMSLTLQDTLQFTGLPILGNDYASLIGTQDLPRLSERYLNPSSYSQVIKQWHTITHTSPTPDERISFMWVLICKYLFGPSSGKPTMEYLPLARSLSVGAVHGLGVMFLGAVYKWLNVTVTEAPISKLNGTSWLLQMWLFSYFPELASPSSSLNENASWKELLGCRCDLNAGEVFTFFQSLPFSRPYERLHSFTIDVDTYSWIESLAASTKSSTMSILDAIHVSIHHPRFLVPDGVPIHDSSTHSFNFYNPALYPFQLGFCPQVPSTGLYLPQTLNEMTIAEISCGRLSALALLELSEQTILFKSPLTKLPPSVTDGYLPWWTAKYSSLVPKSLKAPATQGIKRIWDLSATRQGKKFEQSPAPIVDPPKAPLVTPSASHSRRGTRSSARLCGKSSKTVPSKTTEYVTLEDDTGSPSFSHDVSGDISATESDEQIHSTSLLFSQQLREIHIQGQTGGHRDDHLTADSSSQGLSAKRANAYLVDEDIDFNFDFLRPGSSDTTLVSHIPSGLELATAKASLRHFRNMNLAALGPIEKATILSAASILKNSPDFAQSSTSGVLDGLPAMFSAFHDSSATCSETLIHLGNFKAQKEKLDGMVEERKAVIATLHQKNQEFDLREALVKKLEAELAQHRSDMLVLLHDSEALKASSDKLRLDIQNLGGTLVNQKQSYQQWEDNLKKAEVIRAECYSSWEDLRYLDL